MKPQNMIDIVRNWGTLTKALNGINKAVEEAAKSRFHPADKRETLLHLTHQLEKETEGYAFYFMTAKDLGLKDKRQGPLVTVALAKMKRTKNSFRFARGVGVCYPKDTPSKTDGKVAAARHLLKTIHHGRSMVNPNSSDVEEILEKLVTKKLIGLHHLDYVVGDWDVNLSAKEAKIAASIGKESTEKPGQYVIKHWVVSEEQECASRAQALEVAECWKEADPKVQFTISRVK